MNRRRWALLCALIMMFSFVLQLNGSAQTDLELETIDYTSKIAFDLAKFDETEEIEVYVDLLSIETNEVTYLTTVPNDVLETMVVDELVAQDIVSDGDETTEIQNEQLVANAEAVITPIKPTAEQLLSVKTIPELLNNELKNTELAATLKQTVTVDVAMSDFKSEKPELYSEYFKAKNLDDAEISDVTLQTAIEDKRDYYVEKYTENNEQIINSILDEDSIIYVSKYSPMAIAKVTKEEAIALASDLRVVGISECEQGEAVSYLDDATVASKAHYLRDDLGYTGAGVNVGILDTGVPEIYGALADKIVYYNNERSNYHNHATVMAKIFIDPNIGIAPDVNLWVGGFAKINTSEDSPGTRMVKIVEWMIGRGVNIISCSAGIDIGRGTYNRFAKWIDHISLQHDTHFVVASGNDWDGKVSSFGMAYNAMTVGAYGTNGTVNTNLASNNKDDTMYYDIINDQRSCFMSEDGSRCCKPNIVAPGVGITVGDLTTSGTSFSAPIVAAVMAQLCEADSDLKTKQTSMNAILLASATLKVEELNDSGQTGDSFKQNILDSNGNIVFAYRLANANGQMGNREGAGKLDAYRALEIINNENYSSRTFTGTADQSYTITKYVTAGKVTRAAIFWLNNRKISTHYDYDVDAIADYDLSTLTLNVYDQNNNFVAQSILYDVNYQIVQFTPQTSGNYKFIIRKFTDDSSIDQTKISPLDYYGFAFWDK